MSEETKLKAPVYRDLDEEEIEALFAYYDKHNGNVLGMSLDKDCQFHSRNQISHYRNKYDFRSKLAHIRAERAREVMKNLNDSKIRAIEMAQKMLEPRHQLVFKKGGTQVFDEEGEPVIVENLPFYKELKVCWEIIKSELGEPTQNIGILGAKDLAKKLDEALNEDIPNNTQAEENN